jgi:hypothetical protein
METKALTNPTSGANGPAARLDLFGPPLIIEGEDAASYDQLLARLCAAVKPVDIIDEIFIADVASLEWEVLRWRRLKWSLMRACGLEALKDFFAKQLDYNVYSERFADFLAQILRDHLPEDQRNSAQTLADKCARNEEDAVDKVCKVLHGIPQTMRRVQDDARAHKASATVRAARTGRHDADP